MDLSKYKKQNKKHIPARIPETVLIAAQFFAKKVNLSLTDYISEAIIRMNAECNKDVGDEQ